MLIIILLIIIIIDQLINIHIQFIIYCPNNNRTNHLPQDTYIRDMRMKNNPLDGWMDEWVNELMDGWMDGWIDGIK